MKGFARRGFGRSLSLSRQVRQSRGRERQEAGVPGLVGFLRVWGVIGFGFWVDGVRFWDSFLMVQG